MRPLVRLRHDIYFLNPPEFIDLAGKAVLARPFRPRPRRPLLRIWVLVIFALEAEGLITPCQLEEAEDLFESLAIDAVGFAFVTGGGADVNFLRHLIEPSRLVAACKADKCAALGELIEPGDFQRQAQRVPSRQYVANRPHLNVFGVMNDMLREHRQTAEFKSFAVQVMFREGDRVEAHVFSETRQFGHFIDHALPALRMARYRAQLPPFFERGRQSRKEEEHKLHCVRSPFYGGETQASPDRYGNSRPCSEPAARSQPQWLFDRGRRRSYRLSHDPGCCRPARRVSQWDDSIIRSKL